MGEIAAYADGKGVESAIKAAAQKAQAEDPSLTISERIRLEYFNRFLSRVFSEGHESEWVLKGGAGMLARVPSTRATTDIDLYRRGYDLDEAIADLRRLAEVDLGDHRRVQPVEQVQQRRPSVGERPELPVVVVVAEHEAPPFHVVVQQVW